MRVPGLVLMLSVAALGDAGAGEMVLRGQQLAQASSPSGSCMPIGVTAAGELVFPWECREVIERERGPVSLDLSVPPKTSVSNQPVSNPLATSEPAPGKTAAISDGARKQPSAQGVTPEPEHVATIPDAAALPPAVSPVLGPTDRHPQAKRLASSRRQFDPKVTRAPIQPTPIQSNLAPSRTRPSPPG